MNVEKKTPEIRFKGFDGEWKLFSLGELGSVATNKRIFIHETSLIGDVPFYKIGTFGREPKLFISQELFDDYKKRYPFPEKGDLLFSVIGSIGRVVEYTGEDEYFQDSNVVWLKHDGAIVNSFLKQFYSIVEWEGIEGSTIKHLYNRTILGTKIQTPSREEQTQIGNTFQKLDSLINQHQQKHDKLSNIKKAMLEKMFPKQGETTPEIRFKGFHGEWEKKAICDLFTVTRGSVLATTKTSPTPSPDKCYPVYSSQTKNNGLMGFYHEYLFESAITWTTDGANAGTVNFREGKFYSTNVNGVLLSNEGYANNAIAEILNKEAWRHVSHVGNPKLMNNVMSAIKITIPNSVEEQTAIGNYFLKLDDLINQHQQKITKLNNIKQACLKKMFV
ncbi:restriction endonuclease subunit S [Pseudoalteromonas sp. MMG012]|uniref:restriction endonuclease subunit S n=1 Tax=Pseudoalteromonas sp. MMG012 TaxID=2822686 RepID=UPI001B3A2D95|nr:restriction endonuclease subunit S [Pseudoalteromonas sp. MMG012]MBQ4848536.1 restriction endonuclease subunit S [Pseudoalteromonas sp. MMG012]